MLVHQLCFLKKRSIMTFPVQNVMHSVERTGKGGPGHRRHTESHPCGREQQSWWLRLGERTEWTSGTIPLPRDTDDHYLTHVGCAVEGEGLPSELAGALHHNGEYAEVSQCVHSAQREVLSDFPFCSPMSTHSTEERIYLVDGHWKAGRRNEKCTL